MCTSSCADDVQLRERRGRGRSMHVSRRRRRRRINSRRSVGTAFAIRIRSSIKTGCKAQGGGAWSRTHAQGCQMAKFDPFLSLDCARAEGVGAQYKERKASNFAAQRSRAIVQKPEGPNRYDLKILLKLSGNHAYACLCHCHAMPSCGIGRTGWQLI